MPPREADGEHDHDQRREIPLAGRSWPSHAAGMFAVIEAEAAAIRAAFDQGGEFTAAAELRRLFPAITDTAEARECARTIAADATTGAGATRHAGGAAGGRQGAVEQGRSGL